MLKKFFFTLLLVGILVAGCGPLPPTDQESPPVEEPQAGEPSPFEGFPEEYQDIQIPPNLQEMVKAGDAFVLQLPPDKEPLKEELYSMVQDDGYLERYNFERLADYAEERRFVAVPAGNIPEYQDWIDQGVLVGLVYDTSYFYARSEMPVYEVYFFNDRAEVRDRFGMPLAILEVDKDFFFTESSFTPEVLTFFIKNGCWLCWNAGGRCGCLICF